MAESWQIPYMNSWGITIQPCEPFDCNCKLLSCKYLLNLPASFAKFLKQ